MTMLEFSDILYGPLTLPDWMGPFVKLPEFLRLRGVRLSNVDSYQFKDLSGPTRWEHSIAVAHLAQICARVKGLSEQESLHLTLAALLHDVATPPFAHTAEYVLDDYDHEMEGQNAISGTRGRDFHPDFPVFAGEAAQFHKVAKRMSRSLRTEINVEDIARMLSGQGDLGFLIRGTIDLDNADNVVRACLHMGMTVDKGLPLKITDWLARQSDPPTNVQEIHHPDVAQWVRYRDDLYSRFFESSDEELARQAFLQHLMRVALHAGFPRRTLIWNTDDGLLTDLNSYGVTEGERTPNPLAALVRRYKLIEAPLKVARIEIDDETQLRVLRLPQAVAWIERDLSCPGFEAIVLVTSRRTSLQRRGSTLFKPPLGSLIVFKLGAGLKRSSLCPWMRDDIAADVTGRALLNDIGRIIEKRVQVWLEKKPWLELTVQRRRNLHARLEHVGDWSFHLSRNDNIHPYPGTFVYSIPSNLITALELREELIVDPFGGTGQTAIEVVKQGGRVVSADSNSIAYLAAKAKLTYLTPEQMGYLRSINDEELQQQHVRASLHFDGASRWFHKDTLRDLSKIWQFIEVQNNSTVREFLTVCFSAILPNCTGRRGKQHGYFADNTPLSPGVSSPPYQNATEEFIRRLNVNISIVKRFYAAIERDGRNPRDELARARVLKLSISDAAPEDYGVSPNSVAAIITSPPYLCMADYTLGQRLSYYWIGADLMEEDFRRELGARRSRSNGGDALTKYWEGLRAFAVKSATLLRKKGFLCTVLGAPVAKAFQSVKVFEQFDSILKKEGFSLLWSTFRRVQWHRNHGYARLKQERVAVHILDA